MPIGLDGKEIELEIPESFKKDINRIKNKRENFFIIQNSMIDNGILCMLTGQALLLYLVLLRRSFKGIGFIYTEQILQYTSIDKTHISRYITQLTRFKLIQITKHSKKLGYKKYKILPLQDTNIK